MVLLYLLLWLGAAALGSRVLPSWLVPESRSTQVIPGPEFTVAEGVESGYPWEIVASVQDLNTPGADVCTVLRSAGRNVSGQCGYRALSGSPGYSWSAAELPGTGRSVLFGPVPAETATVVISFSDGRTQEITPTGIDGLPGRVFHIVINASGDATVRILDAGGADIAV